MCHHRFVLWLLIVPTFSETRQGTRSSGNKQKSWQSRGPERRTFGMDTLHRGNRSRIVTNKPQTSTSRSNLFIERSMFSSEFFSFFSSFSQPMYEAYVVSSIASRTVEDLKSDLPLQQTRNRLPLLPSKLSQLLSQLVHQSLPVLNPPTPSFLHPLPHPLNPSTTTQVFLLLHRYLFLPVFLNGRTSPLLEKHSPLLLDQRRRPLNNRLLDRPKTNLKMNLLRNDQRRLKVNSYRKQNGSRLIQILSRLVFNCLTTLRNLHGVVMEANWNSKYLFHFSSVLFEIVLL